VSIVGTGVPDLVHPVGELGDTVRPVARIGRSVDFSAWAGAGMMVVD